MAIIKVERPKLSFGEKIYFGAAFKGMIITLGHAFRSLLGKTTGAEELNSSGVGVTMQYPEQKWDDKLPEYYRGAPALVTDERDRERCVSCQLLDWHCGSLKVVTRSTFTSELQSAILATDQGIMVAL
ncbi:MAG: hypothetical protein ACPHOK_09300, partial [Akkermansiaceae bacterium]